VSTRPEPIAIVGIGCRFADARGPAEFYEIVRGRRNTVRNAPQHRIELGYDIDHFYDPRPRIPGKISSKKGGFLEHPELFDPEAFGIAPRDALTMEPQQRLMIEVTWDALDDAGIAPESILGERVAVILGYMAEDYSRERSGVLGEAAVYRGHDVFTVGGMSHAVLSGRISYLLGVTGPSLTLDTACSSSLYAAHLACESLRRGESKLAIAGGANLFLSPEGNIALSRSGMLSMSGACKAFDASADGFVRAEGAGVVVLRPLSDAIAAGNPIYAVIRGSGISADGRDGGHMMAPGRKGQAQAMRDAYAMAGIAPSDVHYVETHGTGTMIGDPVEIGALADVMGPGRSPDRPLRVASIKGNLGHTESASGVAGLINACLAIRHRTLPPQLHFETPNPMIPWAEVPIEVQRELEPWPYPGPALVGVNSFGISGTNAHFVLEAPPDHAARPSAVATLDVCEERSAALADTRPVLLPITAHDPNALHEMAEKIRALLVADPDLDLNDLAYTLSRRRSLRAHRLCLVARDVDEALVSLDAYLAGEASPRLRTGVAGAAAASPLVMVFPGQGSQWLGMGRQLLAREPVFAAAIERIDAAYRSHVEWSLRAVLDGRWAFEGGVDAEWTSRLDVLQPVLVAVEVALAELWRSFGIEPQRVLGQSMGEIAAAHVAGALSLEDMARLACQRGLVVARASGKGAMAVVSLGREVVARRIAEWPGRVEIAGANSPSTTILSGDTAAVAAMVESFEAEGVFARRLEVDFASHCFHMDPLVEPFRRAIGTVAARPSAIPFDSTVDGATKPGEELDADYWLRNLREPVAFDRGLAAALEGGGDVFLEVSPHPALPRAIDETAKALGHGPRYVCSLRRGEDEATSMLVSLAELFVRGRRIDWAALHPAGRVVDLPLYAYQRKRYFFSERSRVDNYRPTHPLLGVRTDSSLDPRLHSWDFPLDADSGSFLGEVRASEQPGAPAVVTAPASLDLELALAAADALWPAGGVRVAELVHARPIELRSERRRTVQVVVREDGRSGGELRIASRASNRDDWLLHATARLLPAPSSHAKARPEATRRLVREGNESVSLDDYYAALERCGVVPGSKGRVLRELECEAIVASEASATNAVADPTAPRVVVGKLMLPRSIESEWYAYHAHPLLVDAAFQLTGALFDATSAVRLVSVESVEIAGSIGSDCLCRAARRIGPVEPRQAARELVADLEFFDRKGTSVGRIGGLRVAALPARAATGLASSSELLRIEWITAELAPLEAEREVDRFILVSDSESNAAWLAAELNKQGVEILFCEKVEDLEPLVARLRATGDHRFGFMLLAWADPSADAAPEPAFQRDFRVGQWAFAIREQVADAAQIWIATRGLQPREESVGTAARVDGSEAGNGSMLASPAAMSLAPHVAREIDTFASCAEMQQCRLFDARADLGDADFAWLASLVGRPGLERQFRMASDGARVPRLVAIDDAAGATSSAGPNRTMPRVIAGERNFRAVLTGREGRAAVALVACDEPELAADEVRVEVRAASLSSFDVLAGMGLALERRDVVRPERTTRSSRLDESLGLDFAGVVTAMGSRVTDLALGDRVAGIAGESSGAVVRRIAVSRGRVAGLPARLDFASAASLVWPGLVARHVLADVARVRPGERVLVVSAGGGVGLSLAERAHALGAEVYATASTQARRAALAHEGATLLDGTATGVEGVGIPGPEEIPSFDVIVSSESGPALHARLAALAPGGRYVDLCPRERFEREELGALRLGANRAVLAVDTLAALESDARGIGARLAEMMAELDEGTLETIAYSRFPVAETARALRFMTQNRHTGRVVLDLEAAERVAIEGEPTAEAPYFAGRHVLISRASRSARGVDLQSALADGLRAAGAAEVREILERDGSPADAWIHIADEACEGPDGLRLRMAEDEGVDRMLVSLRQDVVGDADRDRAWEVRLWVDRLVLAGSGSRVGAATGLGAGRVMSLSIPADATPESVLRALAGIARSGTPREQRVLLSPAEQADRAARAPSPLLSLLDPISGRAGATSFDRSGFLALSPPERRAALLRHVREELAGVLALGAERRDALDPALRLDALGLDSLMTMELFMGLGRGLELSLAADWFPPGPTLSEVAQVLVRRLEASLAGGAP